VVRIISLQGSYLPIGHGDNSGNPGSRIVRPVVATSDNSHDKAALDPCEHLGHTVAFSLSLPYRQEEFQMISFVCLSLLMANPPELKLPPFTVPEKWVMALERPKDVPELKSETPADRIGKIAKPELPENTPRISDIVDGNTIILIVKEPYYLPRPQPSPTFERFQDTANRAQAAAAGAMRGPDGYKDVKYVLVGLDTKNLKAGQELVIPAEGLIVETEKTRDYRGKTLMVINHDPKLIATFAREREAREKAKKEYDEKVAVEKAAQRVKAKYEQDAKGLLQGAKFFMDTGNKAKAKGKLETILSDFPNSTSVAEAKELLSKIK
jgi:hypothetical protein